MISAVGSLIFTALLVSAAAPNPVSVSPSSGPTTGATAITITGTLFQNGCTGTLDGIAIPITFVSPTSLTSTTPADTLGAKTLVIRNPDGKSTSLASAFTYAAATPTVSAITPNLADIAGGGQLLTITGTNFTGATGVTIGGSAATSITVVNATTITCRPPAHAAGTLQSVLVTTPSGTNSANTLFEFWSPAQISGVDFVLHANKGVTGGAAVSAWLDQSAHAVNFTQATGASKPAQTASVFGTMPSIRYAAGQFVRCSALRIFATGYSLFWGGKTSQTYSAITSTGGSPGTVIGQNTGTAWGSVGYDAGAACGIYSHVYDATGTTHPVVVRGASFNDGTARMLGWTSDATANPGPNRKAYVGTTQQGATAAVGGGYDAVDTAFDSIGANVAGADGFVGDLGWVVAVVGVIGGTDQAKLATWSLQQFGF